MRLVPRAPRLAAVLLAAGAMSLAAGAIAAPPPPPAPMLTFQGRDQVVIGRIYWREGGSTQPVARFGTVLGGKTFTHAVSVASAESGPLTVTFAGRRDGEDAAQVSWSVLPGAGARVPAAQGKLKVEAGGVGHAALGTGGGGELFASLETGRASAFNIQRLWEHFGIVTDAQRFAVATPAGEQRFTSVAPPPAPPAPAPARGGTFTVSCASGSIYDLSTGSGSGRCELDIEGDRILGGTCDDDAGNAAKVSCTLGGCLSTSGSGSCRAR